MYAPELLREIEDAINQSEEDQNKNFDEKNGPTIMMMDSDLILHEPIGVAYDPENGTILIRLQPFEED